VTAIAKGLEPWMPIDAGCFVLTAAIFEALRRARLERSPSAGCMHLAACGHSAASKSAAQWSIPIRRPILPG
jgi:hypothetical protein